MKKFYFIAGEFINTSSGIFSYSYTKNQIGIICEAKTYNEAKEKMIDFCTQHFGKPYEEQDMWYWEKCYPWNFIATTEHFYYHDVSLKTNEFNI